MVQLLTIVKVLSRKVRILANVRVIRCMTKRDSNCTASSSRPFYLSFLFTSITMKVEIEDLEKTCYEMETTTCDLQKFKEKLQTEISTLETQVEMFRHELLLFGIHIFVLIRTLRKRISLDNQGY